MLYCIIDSTPPLVMFATGSDVRAYHVTRDHQYAFISGEKRIQSIDYDASKGKYLIIGN